MIRNVKHVDLLKEYTKNTIGEILQQKAHRSRRISKNMVYNKSCGMLASGHRIDKPLKFYFIVIDKFGIPCIFLNGYCSEYT